MSPAISADQERFAALVREWNQKFNLVSRGDLDRLRERHIEDSLKLYELFPEVSFERAVDVGSGAGFPGLPLSIADPRKRFDLLESVGKKCAFLQAAVSELGLQNAAVLNGRAETFGQESAYRERYDLAVTRALAHPAAALELVLPFTRVGGACVFWGSGPGWDDRDTLEKVTAQLGGVLSQERTYTLDNDPRVRKLILMRKSSPSPRKFPRRPGLPSKNPLGSR